MAILLEKSLSYDNDPIKIGSQLKKKSHEKDPSNYSDRFEGTKILQMGLSFTKKQLFDPNLWPYSLVYLLMIPNINPRQQLQMIVL
jgi:hypothetical protein